MSCILLISTHAETFSTETFLRVRDYYRLAQNLLEITIIVIILIGLIMCGGLMEFLIITLCKCTAECSSEENRSVLSKDTDKSLCGCLLLAVFNTEVGAFGMWDRQRCGNMRLVL